MSETPAKRVVKGSKNRGAERFFSDKKLGPLNGVYDEKGAYHEGLSEEQKIEQGYQYPYVQKIDFTKSEEDRKKLAKIAKPSKRITGWLGSDVKRNDFRTTLIVHLLNRKKDKDFKTTYTFKDVAEHEVQAVLSTIIRVKDDDKHDKFSNYYSKYFYAGKTYLGGSRG